MQKCVFDDICICFNRHILATGNTLRVDMLVLEKIANNIQENLNQETQPSYSNNPCDGDLLCGVSDVEVCGAHCNSSVINTTDKAVTNDRLRILGF